MKFKTKETEIWFSSDPHYGHTNIVRGVSDWSNKDGCRDFKTVSEMNSHIVSQYNKYIKEDDVLFMLGDWSFGGIENIWNFRKQLLCKNIHLILGNHDYPHIGGNSMRELPNVKRAYPYSATFVDAEPEGGEYPDYLTAKELFSSVQDYLKITIDKKEVILSHYPMAAWDRSYKGSWMLHGHSHGTMFAGNKTQWAGSDNWYTSGKILDVGIDNAHSLLGEYKPLSYEYVKKLMDKKEIRFTDHHDARTN